MLHKKSKHYAPKISREKPATFACDAKNHMSFEVEGCEMLVIWSLIAVWLAMGLRCVIVSDSGGAM